MTRSEFEILSKKIVKVYNIPVEFDYVEIKKDDYETDLMDSFIHSKSPDIFLITNEDLGEFKKLISPFDLNQKSYNISNLDKDFPTIVKEQAVLGNELYMLPITIDSLALYYNRNVFDSLSIPTPPKTWGQTLELISKLRQLDSYNRITRSPIGMGLGNSINNSSDILSLLILQLNGEIINKDNQLVKLDNRVNVNGNYINPSQEALKFYAQFSQSNNQYYSWNASFNNDLEAFANNKLALYIGYYEDKDLILNKNPNLSFGISEMPQRDASNNVNFGKFTGFTVSSQTKNKDIAWGAIQMLTSSQNVQEFIEYFNLPPATRDLISIYYNDPDLGVFAKQSLSSKSFYHPSKKQTKKIFKETLDQLALDRDYSNALDKMTQDLKNLIYNQ